MSSKDVYIIAARRAANGRIGGLHRNRRIEDLAGPVLAETLAAAGLSAGQVEQLFVGNTTAGNNPARLIGLVGGLGDDVASLTIDRQEGSGLEAILSAARAIQTGSAGIVIAGGAEAVSMAPWRIVKPRHMHQTPRFIGFADAEEPGEQQSGMAEAANSLAARHELSREQIDLAALASHLRACEARDERRFAKEIVALRSRPEEHRDEPVGDLEIEDLAMLPPLAGDGHATTGNLSPIADGAAFVAMVSDAIHKELGRPPALRLVKACSAGRGATRGEPATVHLARRITRELGLSDEAELGRIELGEGSAAEELVFRSMLGLPEGAVNSDGGQVARGMPLGASGAVLVARLFAAIVSGGGAGGRAKSGLAVAAISDGQAIGAAFERAGS